VLVLAEGIEVTRQARLQDSSSVFAAGQLVTSEQGVRGGPLPFHHSSHLSHIAFVNHWLVLNFFNRTIAIVMPHPPPPT
jgi:hypothetical protein